MGNISDCIKAAIRGEDTPQQQQQLRGFPATWNRYPPQWIPPSPIILSSDTLPHPPQTGLQSQGPAPPLALVSPGSHYHGAVAGSPLSGTGPSHYHGAVSTSAGSATSTGPGLNSKTSAAGGDPHGNIAGPNLIMQPPHEDIDFSADSLNSGRLHEASTIGGGGDLHYNTRPSSGAWHRSSHGSPASPPAFLQSTKPQVPESTFTEPHEDRHVFSAEIHVDLPRPAWLDYSTDKPKVVRKLFSEHDSSHKEQPSAPTDSDSTPHSSAVDINRANVHQLHVVGLTREQAEAVVDYRVRRNRFQSVGELRNVPGIDEETWFKVKFRVTIVPAVTCNSKTHVLNGCNHRGIKGNSPKLASSERDRGYAQRSLDLEEITNKADSNETRISLDLNFSNYHELCAAGLSLPQAHALVNYRTQHGPFTSKEDIKLVPGITDEVYQHVRSKLTLVPTRGHTSSPRRRQPRGKNSKSFLAADSSPLHKLWLSPTIVGVDRAQSPPELPQASTGAVSSTTVTSPHNIQNGSHPRFTSGYASSPKIPGGFGSPKVRGSPSYSGGKFNRGTLRMASWNLQCFNKRKSDNPGVLEVICSLILQHGYV